MRILAIAMFTTLIGCQGAPVDESVFDELQRIHFKREHEQMILAKPHVTAKCMTGAVFVYPRGTTEEQVRKDCRGSLGLTLR